MISSPRDCHAYQGQTKDKVKSLGTPLEKLQHSGGRLQFSPRLQLILDAPWHELAQPLRPEHGWDMLLDDEDRPHSPARHSLPLHLIDRFDSEGFSLEETTPRKGQSHFAADVTLDSAERKEDPPPRMDVLSSLIMISPATSDTIIRIMDIRLSSTRAFQSSVCDKQRLTGAATWYGHRRLAPAGQRNTEKAA